jgi:DNA-binding MarR family transcriptional regulator
MTQDGGREALLSALHHAMRAFTSQVTFYSEAVAATVGLHPTDLDCLSVIELEGPLTAGRLADITGLTTGAVTGVIDRLERAGYVERAHDTTDRRRVLVGSVDDSLATLSAAFVPMIASSTAMATRYDDDQLAAITDYVTRSTPMLREETLRLRDLASESSDAVDDVDEVVMAGSGSADATLRIVSGAARLAVVAQPDQPQLFSAQFWGGRPTTRQEGDTVIVQYRRSPFGRFRTRGTVTLAADRRWRIDTAHGLANCTFDLTRTTIDSFSHTGGMSSVDLALPRPRGVMRVDIRGGVHAVTISRPSGVAASVSVKGGAANLVLDDKRFGAIGGGIELESDGATGTQDRLEVVIRGGSSSLSVVTRPPR